MGRLIALCLVALLAGGCFAIDELDSGMDTLNKHSMSGKKKAEPESEAASGKGKPAPGKENSQGLVARLQGWWQSRSGGQTQAAEDDGPPPHPDDVLGRCENGGSVQFTRKFDCQLRGGSFRPLPPKS